MLVVLADGEGVVPVLVAHRLTGRVGGRGRGQDQRGRHEDQGGRHDEALTRSLVAETNFTGARGHEAMLGSHRSGSGEVRVRTEVRMEDGSGCGQARVRGPGTGGQDLR